MPSRMDEEQLRWDLEHAASVRLLKADHAAFIVSFLHQQFKRAQRVSVPLSELIEQLEGYLESLNEREPGRYGRTAQEYITQWADQQHRFIRIVADGPSVELTSDAERAIGWLEDLHPQSFIGTESRFHLIVQLIRDIVQKSIEDPTQRLAQLEQQRAELDQQIETIRRTGKVDQRYSAIQVRERFFEASSLARQLLRDFRLVEERFRGIARNVQQAQLQPGARKGSLIEYVLDADDELKSSDQGRSFYTFWEFLMAPSQADALQDLLEQLTYLDDLQSALNEDRLLPHLPGYLVAAAESVVRSNARLAEQLRRLLDEQAAAENRRVHELILDIQQEGYHLREIDFKDPAFTELEGPPDIRLDMERELWEPTKSVVFHEQPLTVMEEDLRDIDFSALYTQFSIDEKQIRRNVEALLEQKPQILLSEVLACYPVEKGLSEILAYCVLAAEDPRHFIDASSKEQITFVSGAYDAFPRERMLVLPQICYRRNGDAK